MTLGFARLRAAVPRSRYPESRMYIFITAVLAFLIAGYGVAFAFGCRLPELEERDRG
ncbi:MAG: hypothetical protein ACE5JR_01960 [Gemmatimonadota bacterium]